ncbi:MAG: flagellar hook-basal body complex protein [Candidatus Eisenbacteria bacterium]|nr:flagellar hook-basal body complex protein [Candidatus Latescibacterota bacterium]MBD3302456.1 flagellar hook-basal body complex protein [Candidatus Eisenbacteria bacterium]
MMPLRGVEQTARSLSRLERFQEATAFNLAHANADGFKAIRMAARGSDPDGGTVESVQFEQGAIRETGRPLDVALEGPGFLVVRTAGGERFTRGGALRLDPEGRLVDRAGDPILGEAGEIVVAGTDLTIQSDGTVVVDGAVNGKLRLAEVADPAELQREQPGRFVPTAPPRDPLPGATLLRQGAIEEANVDPLASMVDLLTIQRAYAANVQALRAMDGVLGATNELGEVR